MNWLIIISHAAAMNLSYYNAGEGDSRRLEADARKRAQRNWDFCRTHLQINDLYDEFMRAGAYLIRDPEMYR